MLSLHALTGDARAVGTEPWPALRYPLPDTGASYSGARFAGLLTGTSTADAYLFSGNGASAASGIDSAFDRVPQKNNESMTIMNGYTAAQGVPNTEPPSARLPETGGAAAAAVKADAEDAEAAAAEAAAALAQAAAAAAQGQAEGAAADAAEGAAADAGAVPAAEALAQAGKEAPGQAVNLSLTGGRQIKGYGRAGGFSTAAEGADAASAAFAEAGASGEAAETDVSGRVSGSKRQAALRARLAAGSAAADAAGESAASDAAEADSAEAGAGRKLSTVAAPRSNKAGGGGNPLYGNVGDAAGEAGLAALEENGAITVWDARRKKNGAPAGETQSGAKRKDGLSKDGLSKDGLSKDGLSKDGLSKEGASQKNAVAGLSREVKNPRDIYFERKYGKAKNLAAAASETSSAQDAAGTGAEANTAVSLGGKPAAKGFAAELTVEMKADGSFAVQHPASTSETAGGGGRDTPGAFLAGIQRNLPADSSLSGELVRQAGIVLRDGGDGLIRLNLKPESLGNVKIRLNMEGNRISGEILVETKEALKAFEQQVHEMEKAFEAQGYDSARLEMSLANNGQGGGADSAQTWTASASTAAAARYEAAGEAEARRGREFFFPERELDVLV